MNLVDKDLKELAEDFQRDHETCLKYKEELKRSLSNELELLNKENITGFDEEGNVILSATKENVLKFAFLSGIGYEIPYDNFETYIQDDEWTFEGIAFLTALRKLSTWRRHPELLLGVLTSDIEKIYLEMLRGTE